MRPCWTAVVMATSAAISFAVATSLSGCANDHDRSDGHVDITFSISPRGDELVFNAVGEGGRDLYRLDLTTSRVSRIAATPDYEVDPEFSPDGQSVVFAAGKPGDRADHIFLRTLDGKKVSQLTREDANDASPAFSPDGLRIVFTRDKTYNWGGLASHWDAGGVLCVAKADGSALREITKDGLVAIDPHFAPDGKMILFWGTDGLSQVAADGSQPPSPLPVQNGREAVYSPDGQSIGFSTGRYEPDHRIFMARADGRRPREVTHRNGKEEAFPGGGCFRPSFTPDGKHILFLEFSWPDGPTGAPKESLWRIDVDGEDPRKLAGYGLFDAPLNWRPEPPKPANK